MAFAVAPSLPSRTLRRSRTCARPSLTASLPVRTPVRSAALEAPAKTDLGALERMFAAPAAELEPKLDPGRKAKVMLLNDAANERTYVSRVLMKVCPEISADEAWSIMMTAHKKGAALVGIYPFEQAEMIVEMLGANGLMANVAEM